MNMTALSTAAHAAAAAHRVPVALSPGDGIGPEIMRQALRVLESRRRAHPSVSRGCGAGGLPPGADERLDFVKTEHLFTFDGQPGYTAGQGQ